MVPDAGTLSNFSDSVIAEDGEGNSEDVEQQEQRLTPEFYKALFDTLADWNEYLESHLPNFKELSL